MTAPHSEQPTATGSARPTLDLAIVVRADEEGCTVVRHDTSAVVPYAAVFPRPRADRVAPGHLVAVATFADGREVVIWRWFDAVVVDAADGQVRLWEPMHGEVVAGARVPHTLPRPGSRAYISAGLPGAEWWLAGDVVARAELAEVELDEVARFFADNELWEQV